MAGTQGEIEPSAHRAVGTARVLRAVFAILGRPVLLNALAVSVALGIPAAILFSSNGLRAKDVITLAHHSVVTRALLWAGWLALGAPALRALFEAPGARTLRALRPPTVPLVGSLLSLAALTQAPWAILFLRGGGLWAGCAAVAFGVALASASIAGRRRPRWAWFAVLGASLVMLDPPSLLLALVGAAFAPLALQAAWRVALEEPRLKWRLIRPTHPLFALYLAHVLRLVRAARSRLMVAFVCGAGGAAGLVFSLRNDPTERPLQRALTAMALPLTIAAAACVAPILESEARLRGLLRSLRTPRSFVLSAFLLAIATPSSALAATAGVAASNAVHARLGGLVPPLLAWALALSVAVALWGRFLEWRTRRTAGTFAAGVTLIAAGALVAAFSW